MGRGSNGELRKFAAGEYEIFLTMGRRLADQQKVAHLAFGVVLLLAPSNRLGHLRLLMAEILRILPSAQPGWTDKRQDR